MMEDMGGDAPDEEGETTGAPSGFPYESAEETQQGVGGESKSGGGAEEIEAEILENTEILQKLIDETVLLLAELGVPESEFGSLLKLKEILLGVLEGNGDLVPEAVSTVPLVEQEVDKMESMPAEQKQRILEYMDKWRAKVSEEWAELTGPQAKAPEPIAPAGEPPRAEAEEEPPAEEQKPPMEEPPVEEAPVEEAAEAEKPKEEGEKDLLADLNKELESVLSGLGEEKEPPVAGEETLPPEEATESSEKQPIVEEPQPVAGEEPMVEEEKPAEETGAEAVLETPAPAVGEQAVAPQQLVEEPVVGEEVEKAPEAPAEEAPEEPSIEAPVEEQKPPMEEPPVEEAPVEEELEEVVEEKVEVEGAPASALEKLEELKQLVHEYDRNRFSKLELVAYLKDFVSAGYYDELSEENKLFVCHVVNRLES